MDSVDLVLKYFPKLSEKQNKQFSALGDLYGEWNEKINVISRKDIENLYLHHVLHSLAIAKYINFAAESKVLDIGTGGGFPGIPLAIMFPEVQFTLCDSIGKKIKVVNEVAQALNLKNINAINGRAEQINKQFHFIVSRAVTKFPDFYNWTRGKFEVQQINDLSNGILYLKGGDLHDEVSMFGKKLKLIPIHEYFSEDFFEEKKIIYLPVV